MLKKDQIEYNSMFLSISTTTPVSQVPTYYGGWSDEELYADLWNKPVGLNSKKKNLKTKRTKKNARKIASTFSVTPTMYKNPSKRVFTTRRSTYTIIIRLDGKSANELAEKNSLQEHKNVIIPLLLQRGLDKTAATKNIQPKRSGQKWMSFLEQKMRS